MNNINVTSHIGRDLLQSANMFKTADVAVWEYVVNSLEYVTLGTTPKITIDIDNRGKSITIRDNGRGMDLAGLSNFFTMHGENIDRKQGIQGRGKFGTGKSAAFGIGKRLTVSSVVDNIQNTITLHRADIDASDGGEIPVEIIESGLRLEGIRNGTVIRIEEIFVPKIDSQKIIKKVEKHLQSFRHSSPEILVGDHICTYKEPFFQETVTFTPEENLKRYLGDTQLIVKTSQKPLDRDERGILVSCGPGNLVAMVDAGVCSKEMGEFLFGDIDVPTLESNEYDMDAFSSSRDMDLRPEHPVVIALTMFIGTSLEEVRKELVKQKKEALKTEVSKRLKEQADKIADLLNSDFKELNDKVLEIRSSTSNFGKFAQKPAEQNEDDGQGWVSGLEERGELTDKEFPIFESGDTPHIPQPSPNPGPETPNSGEPDKEGTASLDATDMVEARKPRRPKGGFSVEYKHMGASHDRATYTADKGVFTVNLDHPLVHSASTNLGISDLGFQRLSHEIIFSEYALALANMAAVDDPDIPADDVIYDARETLNRISIKSAILYESQ
ncbi:MAG: ATP-binding protein [Proteobacteria bacterium]|nr:ATP-binding protein [Pseudomonadota bacterium]